MPSYRSLRPTLRVKSPEEFSTPAGKAGLPLIAGGAVSPFSLSDTFAFHPGMDALHQGPWAAGQLAIVHAAGLPSSVSTTRSHFDAMWIADLGAADLTLTSGLLNRFLSELGASARLPALGTGAALPRSLGGPSPAFGIEDLASFSVGGFADVATAKAVLGDWQSAGTDVVSTAAGSTLQVVDLVDAVDWTAPAFAPAGGAVYEQDPIGSGLRQVAMAIKANLGLRAAAVDFDHWDTHSGHGVPEDPQAWFRRQATALSNALTAFWLDLGTKMSEVTVVVETEFGRTIGENGSGGTDHGRGGAMLVMGGNVRGGVFGRFPTTISEGPEGDLEVLNDWRTVLAEVLTVRGGLPLSRLSTVLPGWSGTPLGLCQP
jgi:uncharacterized protein (DUF1501 family)